MFVNRQVSNDVLQRRRHAKPVVVKISELLDLVIHDYKAYGQGSLAAKGVHSSPPRSVAISGFYQGVPVAYDHDPQLLDRIPPVKNVAKDNVRKGLVDPEHTRHPKRRTVFPGPTSEIRVAVRLC
jgi:hypothetical protein